MFTCIFDDEPRPTEILHDTMSSPIFPGVCKSHCDAKRLRGVHAVINLKYLLLGAEEAKHIFLHRTYDA